MPSFTCPSCDTDNEVEWEDLPDRACDSAYYECQHCGQEMTIGWVAEIEVRSVRVNAGDLADEVDHE